MVNHFENAMKSLVLVLTLLPLILFSQEKGLNPIVKKDSIGVSNTYALVIGISDYQNQDIPDLKYADKDAQAFANYLKSDAGGNLDADHLKLYLDKEATQAQFAAGIVWLWENAKENDNVIIYFSGHGDVERKSLTQPGYLLCWDAPSKIYMGGGAFSLSMLQEAISTLSLQNKAKVIMIADACRSGKLSGSSVGGSQITGSNLAKSYANEIKILSCQPDEFSIEGKQWGGGRGAFSFHLLNGLYGMADENVDLEVNLKELSRYIEDRVSEEVAPQQQNPMIIGNKTEKIATVNEEILAQINLAQSNDIDYYADINIQIKNGEIFPDVDSTLLIVYQSYKDALKENNFLAPTDNCADYFYNQLMLSDSLSVAIRSSITAEYTVALQNEAQQSINAILSQDQSEVIKSRVKLHEKYKNFPKLLHRAAEILGPDHYMFNSLTARELLFEGFLLYLTYSDLKEQTPEQGEEILNYYTQSLKLESENPVTYYFMSLCYGKMNKDSNNSIISAESAVEYAGTWLLPYINLAKNLAKNNDFESAKYYLDQAILVDSTDVNIWKGWTAYYLYQKDFNEALQAAKKATLLAPNDSYAWLNLGGININTKNIPDAEIALLKCIELDSSQVTAYHYLAICKQLSGNETEAEAYYIKAIETESNFELSRISLTKLYTRQKKYAEANIQYIELVKMNDTNLDYWLELAKNESHLDNADKSLYYLEELFKRGFKDIDKIKKDKAFSKIATTDAYSQLESKYIK
jgi:uncharacterized caspase-like protein/Tfp pilus assembly protein PilF